MVEFTQVKFVYDATPLYIVLSVFFNLTFYKIFLEICVHCLQYCLYSNPIYFCLVSLFPSLFYVIFRP
jgi:hypothetical protein